MNNIILAAGLILIAIAVVMVVTNNIKTGRTLESIEEMLDAAINGNFSTENFDETRLSRLEAKLERFLDSSSISAQNVKTERDNIKELISDISHQTKTPIANLILYSELLNDSDISNEQKGNVSAIHEQAEKLRFLTIVSSIVSRKLELAMLEAVGMTKSMQRKIIRLEGLIYGAIASVSGVVLSSVFSVLLVRRMGAEMWFFTYKFTLIPVAIVLPIMILVAVIIPDIIYRSAMKETVVERLRLVY